MAAAAVVTVSMGVMKPVLAKLATLMGDEYKKLKGVHKEVTFLQCELSDMDALLEMMDNAGELNPQAKKWRKDIIEMSYNIEDCIDDFMQHVGEADDKMGILRKASKYLKTFKDRRRLANQLQEIRAQVMEASERRKRYMLDQCISITAPVVVDPRLSALYKESASLVGIDSQKEELIKLVMDKEQQLNVISIVGLGGLGKTTLVNELYHKVGAQFNCKAFVSVSQKPEMRGLFNSLLSQFGLGTYSHACQVQDPINKLREHLQNKRYFVIVDDLWDMREWDTIQYAFPQNNQCSRVMITTRKVDLATSCCSNHRCVYMMKPLSEPDSRKLFFGRIFGSEDACPSELSKASCEILKKCGGLPLAIITMASMLACQPTRLEGHWEDIQHSLSNKFATNSNYEDMIYILDLSYRNLPRELKACFLYLGSYPEDHRIPRVELVRRWVAEGFVSNSAGQDVWDVAERYFNELVHRSMIQFEYEYFTGEILCKVHDMFLELIVRRCKEDNFLSLINGPQAATGAQDSKVIHRLTVVGSHGTEDDKVDKSTAGSLSQIRSLTIMGGSNWMPPLLEFKCLRVLHLNGYYDYETNLDLSVINQLSQLRYLKTVVHAENNTVLPCQIRGLRLLETFELSGRRPKHNISFEIVDAPRLSHLVMTYEKTMLLPDCIGKMESLRTLHDFGLRTDSLVAITGLGKLTTLSDLGIYFAKEFTGLPKETWMPALSASLEKLGKLKQLSMRSEDRVALCADALGSLFPPSHDLERLYLNHAFTFSRVPRWIGHLHRLHDLTLGAKQVLQEDVAIIGTRLPSLVKLYLRIPGVPTEERLVIGASTGFPALELFEFDCDRISYLAFEAGAMPELWSLKLLFDADEWDKEAPGGLQHLASLENIVARLPLWRGKRQRPRKATNEDADAALIRRVFQEAADNAVPAHPTFTFYETFRGIRPMEEEDGGAQV